VLYCQEQFKNDGSFISSIMKNIKRVAAGEFNRELSAKVLAGSCRSTRMGFKQGGAAGYGLQRVLLDQHGSTRCILAPGDRKALISDRVVLQPGRPEEIKTVRRVFRSFVIDRKSEFTIAGELNAERILNENAGHGGCLASAGCLPARIPWPRRLQSKIQQAEEQKENKSAGSVGAL
jgi:hypothetical protein